MKQKIACGRTEEDAYLCCRRKHRWWNTKWIYFYGWNCYCRRCGHLIIQTNYRSKKEVKKTAGWR